MSIRLMRVLAVAGLGASTLALGACGTTRPSGPPQEIVSVQYDANNFDQSEIDRAALAQCRAKGYRYAVPYAGQPNMQSNGWNYKTFACY